MISLIRLTYFFWPCVHLLLHSFDQKKVSREICNILNFKSLVQLLAFRKGNLYWEPNVCAISLQYYVVKWIRVNDTLTHTHTYLSRMFIPHEENTAGNFRFFVNLHESHCMKNHWRYIQPRGRKQYNIAARLCKVWLFYGDKNRAVTK